MTDSHGGARSARLSRDESAVDVPGNERSDVSTPLVAGAREELFELHRRMVRIRCFEERAGALYRDSEIPGFVHLSIGQEAVAVGACWPLAATDFITSTHRGHGHCLAKGADMTAMFAELLGREAGTCRGRGGSMHIADPQLGILGANGIVAAGLPIAVGAGLWSKLSGSGAAVVAFFGDGALAQGAFHESLNLASLWRLPLVFVCENNQYAEFSPASEQHPVPVLRRADAYGIEACSVDGTDVLLVASTMADRVERCKRGEGPFFVEALTYRFHGHYEGDPERYRDQDEVAAWRARDPLEISARHLRGEGVTDPELADVLQAVTAEVDAAVHEARLASEPSPADLARFVTVPRAQPAEPVQPETEERFRTMDAIREALAYELEHDASVFVVGIDVGKGGNVFGLTRGLHDRWPDRVLDAPISEMAIVGTGVGAAMAGARAVVEVMYFDFIGVCLDQIMNQAAKLHFMTGGAATVPLTIRTQFGAGRSAASQHSQSLEALVAHLPGLTVVMPSTPADTYGLLRNAIRDPNPVIFIEHRGLYGKKGTRPDPAHIVPFGRARIVRQGTDLTIVAVSRMVDEAVATAEALATDGVEAEVIDLRTIVPLDLDTVLASVAKTTRLLVAHEAVRDFGIGAEIAASVGEHGFWNLDAPITRVGAPYTPAPYAPSLERAWLPGRDDIENAARRLVEI